jgi:tRNA(Ile)-lysidine synthase
MISLQQQLKNNLSGPCRVKMGTAMIVAVSGGPDSMALLHLLAAVRVDSALELTVVRVDHGLRPHENPKEHRVVAEAAEHLGLLFIEHSVDVAGFAAERHLSIEHAARDLRYGVLRQVARDRKARCIAVAHTADDQVEEILLRLLRGSGRKGVSGMRMRSNDLIRPLLCTQKETLLAWLAQHGIAHCFDSSNNDLMFLRNRIRHQLLPFLEEHFNPGIRKSLRKTADSLAEDEDLLAGLTAEALAEVVQQGEETSSGVPVQIKRQLFCTLHPTLQRRIVEQLLWQIGARAGYEHILLVVNAAVNGRNQSELHLSHGLRVGIFRDYLEFSYPHGQISWRGRLLS